MNNKIIALIKLMVSIFAATFLVVVNIGLPDEDFFYYFFIGIGILVWASLAVSYFIEWMGCDD